MKRLRSSGIGFFVLVMVIVVWVYAYNQGSKKSTVEDLPVPCSSPVGLAMPPESAAFFAGMEWTCNNGIWTTDGVQR